MSRSGFKSGPSWSLPRIPYPINRQVALPIDRFVVEPFAYVTLHLLSLSGKLLSSKMSVQHRGDARQSPEVQPSAAAEPQSAGNRSESGVGK